MKKTYKTEPNLSDPGSTVVAKSMGFYLGLDLGQSRDYSALVVLEKVWKRGHADTRGRALLQHFVRFVKRYPLGTSYPDVVADVKETFLGDRELYFEEIFEGYGLFRAKPYIVIDATGVGAAVRDEFIKLGITRPTLQSVIITGGLDERYEKGIHRVPKSRLL